MLRSAECGQEEKNVLFVISGDMLQDSIVEPHTSPNPGGLLSATFGNPTEGDRKRSDSDLTEVFPIKLHFQVSDRNSPIKFVTRKALRS